MWNKMAAVVVRRPFKVIKEKRSGNHPDPMITSLTPLPQLQTRPQGEVKWIT
jgi:hypothetical protein